MLVALLALQMANAQPNFPVGIEYRYCDMYAYYNPCDTYADRFVLNANGTVTLGHESWYGWSIGGGSWTWSYNATRDEVKIYDNVGEIYSKVMDASTPSRWLMAVENGMQSDGYYFDVDQWMY